MTVILLKPVVLKSSKFNAELSLRLKYLIGSLYRLGIVSSSSTKCFPPIVEPEFETSSSIYTTKPTSSYIGDVRSSRTVRLISKRSPKT